MPTTAPWQRHLRRLTTPPSPLVRLICVPHAGGAASSFQSWIRLVPSSIELWAVQPPGREDRLNESPATDLIAEARKTAEALQWVIDRPYAILGHSMGALIAYETVRILEHRHQRGPDHLFVSSCVAPHQHSYTDHPLDTDEHVLNVAHDLGIATALPTNPDAYALSWPPLRDDLRLFLRYRHTPGARLHCQITVLEGRDEAPRADSQGWAAQTTAGAHTITFRGGHHYLFDDPGTVIAVLTKKCSLLVQPTISEGLSN